MFKYLLLAAAVACLFSPAQARQHRGARAAGCIETGSVMFPVCGMGQPAQDSREASRVARGEAAVRTMGFGVVRERRAVRPALHYDGPIIPAKRVATIGSGTIRSASGATAHVAASATGAFQCLVDRLDEQGYPVRFMGGWRPHGSVRGSLHPAGLALDVNQVSRNVTTPRMPSNEVALANGCGLISGAQWAAGDSGHFQVGGWAGGVRRHYASRHHRHVRYASVR